MSRLVRYTWFVCSVLAAIILLAAVPVFYHHLTQPITAAGPYDLGHFDAPFQILVDLGDLVGSFIGFALAILLFWRKPNDRMALFVSYFCLITAVTGLHVLDYVLAYYLNLPSTYEFWSQLQTPLWVLLFCVFPDGHFMPRYTRWLFLVSLFLTLALLMSFGTEWYLIANLLNLPLFLLVGYAQVYRYQRVLNFAEREQTKWWVFGTVVAMLLSAIASLIHQKVSPPLFNVMPLFLTIAIVRSHLWDIDILIRRTLVYSILTTILIGAYVSSVILLQQVLRVLTGAGSELAIIISTLAIAALFNPLRHRVQDAIDHRFYRRKYDAQQVLARFAATARDEVELERLTGELLNVVNETMQPTQVSLWLKKQEAKRE